MQKNSVKLNKSTKYPKTVTHKEREYVNERTYMDASNYHFDALLKSRVEGMPYLPLQFDGKTKNYYNFEDCQAWHRGEWEGVKT